jgi:hypothetical protein
VRRRVGRLARMLGRRPGATRGRPSPAADLRPIFERLDALEAMVESLQDAVDRQARRHDERLNELAHQLQPSELARVLSEDARRRGL